MCFSFVVNKDTKSCLIYSITGWQLEIGIFPWRARYQAVHKTLSCLTILSSPLAAASISPAKCLQPVLEFLSMQWGKLYYEMSSFKLGFEVNLACTLHGHGNSGASVDWQFACLKFTVRFKACIKLSPYSPVVDTCRCPWSFSDRYCTSTSRDGPEHT